MKVKRIGYCALCLEKWRREAEREDARSPRSKQQVDFDSTGDYQGIRGGYERLRVD